MSKKELSPTKARPKSVTRLHLRRPKRKRQIFIDAERAWVFDNEKQMNEFFAPLVKSLTEEYGALKDDQEIPIESVPDAETRLNVTIESPDEVWFYERSWVERGLEKLPVFIFHRYFDDLAVTHVVLLHATREDIPTYVYFHFLTRSQSVIERYRKEHLAYSRKLEQISFGMLEGDALSEGDDLAVGLFSAMLKLRQGHDIPEDKFQAIGEALRDQTIESADEIWRDQDSSGHVLVTFIRNFPDHEEGDLYYVVVTQQDPGTNVHSLLFSFPTLDESLVDRYRHGENLDSEGGEQDSAH
jgi:hypothetical protein